MRSKHSKKWDYSNILGGDTKIKAPPTMVKVANTYEVEPQPPSAFGDAVVHFINIRGRDNVKSLFEVLMPYTY